ncbi:MAG: glycosyltransferase family 2 protein [Candidatus Daviesbacteria bacterium]|nr:glycosyltransferase family 2 protein [Candidatus Daviesbacteria bacterium]
MNKSFKLDESLSVVIPAYNEGGNLTNLVQETFADAKKLTNDFEIIVVNDGSSDNTGLVADKLAKTYKHVRVIHHNKNQGLARAVWTGIKSANKEIILYIEGDGQQPLKDQLKLLEKIKNADVVLGVRGKRIDYNLFRKILSYGYLFLLRLFFNLKFKDVNWSQAYRRKIFEKIELKSITPFFSTEVAIRASRQGFRVEEAPSTYKPRENGSSSLGNISTAYKMFKEMIMLRLGLLD